MRSPISSVTAPIVSPVLGERPRTPQHPMRRFFRNDEVGAWYDPSDFRSLFQDSAGSIPVTGVEQPVGLMLDKSQGLVRGVELYSGGDVDSVPIGGADFNNVELLPAKTPGMMYEITYTVSDYQGTGIVGVSGTGGGVTWYNQIAYQSGNATVTQRLIAVDAARIALLTRSTNQCRFSNISVRELPGYHAWQDAAASKPVLSARVNWQENTDAVGAAPGVLPSGWSWAQLASGVTGDVLGGGIEDGVGYVDVRIHGTPENTNGALLQLGGSVSVGGGEMVSSFWIKRVAGQEHAVGFNGGGGLGYVYNPIALTDEWKRHTSTPQTLTAGTLYPWLHVSVQQGAPLDVTLRIGGIQLEYGTEATRYQRVGDVATDPADYDWQGWPLYLRSDGVDDYFKLPNLGVAAGYTALFGVSVFESTDWQSLWTQRQGFSGDMIYIDTAGKFGTYANTGSGIASATVPGAVPLRSPVVLTAGRNDLRLFSQVGEGLTKTFDLPSYVACGEGGILFAGGDTLDPSPRYYTAGAFYGCMIVADQPGDSLKESARRYLASKMRAPV